LKRSRSCIIRSIRIKAVIVVVGRTDIVTDVGGSMIVVDGVIVVIVASGGGECSSKKIGTCGNPRRKIEGKDRRLFGVDIVIPLNTRTQIRV
jgi:hypothetical protein